MEPLDLPSMQRDILAIVADLEPTSGIDIYHDLREHHSVTRDPFYANLETLVELDLVEKEAIGRENSYQINEDGQRALERDLEWRRSRIG